MKKRILITIYIILICITIKFAYNTVVNNIVISKYQEGEYSEGLAKSLTYCNFPQKYIPHYNYGNIFYQKGEYKSAIEEYKKALEENVPMYRECSIRINYALAICRTVQVDETNQDSINSAIKTYESAIEVLVQDGCANKNDSNGHSQKAEKLKKDIQKEIDRLKNLKTNNQDSTETEYKEEEEEKEQEKKNQDKTDPIEDKMQQIKQDAIQKQRQTESEYKDYGEKNWEIEKNW